ncbi:SPOR domain-containing protein [Azospirillum argentinense]|uniref:SPOR domain-containing protein n=1 Tax=Azospirillum argentinense TaxID=2970906 RepID=A0A5B0KV26_9PROT|nr:SPOR domain-containing protein [Azospirillum argentinense]KAA1055816.1 hypothetical protein FH063_004791 [Azospirillum argentinense]
MTTITLGRWQVAALAAGVAVLTVVALLLGSVMAALILTGGGNGGGALVASAPAASSVASAGAPAAGGAAGGGLGAMARSSVADSFEARQGVIETADIFSDEARGRAISATEPMTRGAADAARRFLPGWMAGTAAHVIEKTGYRVTEFAGNSVEGLVEDTLNDRLDAMKEEGAAPVRHYAIELGRFATPANAESFAAAAAQRGVRGTVDFAPLPGGNAPYAVRTGRYAAADEAARALDALTRTNGVSGTVVTLAEAGER